MFRFPLLCLLVTLLTGCIGFDLSIKTEVEPDGTIHRRVHGKINTGVQESSHPPSIWELLVEPGEPYDVVKLEQEGFSAIAEFTPGTHPSGIRRRPFPDGEQFAEGRFSVAVSDLVIGKLYSYRETIHAGADPARVRAELRRWLELGLDVAIETLHAELPDADLKGVREHARLHLLPRVECSLLVIHHEFDRLVGFVRDQIRAGIEFDAETLPSLPMARVIEQELGKLGVKRQPEDRDPRNTLSSAFLGFWEVDATLIREVLAPIRGLSDSAKDELAEQLVDRFDDLDFVAASLRLHPDPQERQRLTVEAQQFWIATVGCWFPLMSVPVHPQTLNFRLRLPGSLLLCDGELGRPEAEWNLNGMLLAFYDEEIRAVSFDPIEGLPESGWKVASLHSLAKSLDAMDPAERARLPGYVFMAMDNGWDEVLESEESTPDIHSVLKSMKYMVQSASRHADHRKGEGVED